MTPHAPPIRLSRRTALHGRVFDIEIDRVRLANGRTKAMEIVRHRGSVVLIAQPRPGHVILIRQFRYAIGRWIWELPAGSLERGEAPGRAARRECEEEIGLRPGRVDRIAMFYPSPGFCDERMIFYRCTQLVAPARPRAGDDDEDLEPREFSVTEVRRLIAGGAIVDMKTVAGVSLIR